MNRYGQVLERIAERTRIDPDAFLKLQDRRDRHHRNRRMAAAAVAVAVAGGGAWGAWALAGTRHQVRPATSSTLVTNTAQGITITYPADWTLVQLGNKAREKQAPDPKTWAVLLLANFSPTLEPSHLCPQRLEMPADGVVLYVQRDLGRGPGSFIRKPWPVEPFPVREDPSNPVPPAFSDNTGGCVAGYHQRWTVGDRSFESFIAVGPNASTKDRETIVDAFRSLDFEWIRYLDSWVRFRLPAPTPWDNTKFRRLTRALVETPKQVMASTTANGQRFTFTVMPDPLDVIKGGGPTFVVEFGDLGTGAPPDGKDFIIAQRHMKTPGGPVLMVLGSATKDVTRVEVHSSDGRTFPARMIPFPSNLPGTYEEFFVNLDGLAVSSGEIVALDARGQILQELPLRVGATTLPSPRP